MQNYAHRNTRREEHKYFKPQEIAGNFSLLLSNQIAVILYAVLRQLLSRRKKVTKKYISPVEDCGRPISGIVYHVRVDYLARHLEKIRSCPLCQCYSFSETKLGDFSDDHGTLRGALVTGSGRGICSLVLIRCSAGCEVIASHL